MNYTYHLLPEQNKIWDIERRYPSGDICNVGGYLHLEGKYDEILLQKTMEIFVKTNCSFWTRLTSEGKIYLDEITEYRMEVYDFRELTEEETDRKIKEWICMPFDLYGGYLFDFRILKLRDKTVIFEKFHHLIADGYSVALCAKIQEKIYEQLENGKTDFETDRRYIEELEQNIPKQEERFEDEWENTRFVLLNRSISSADAGMLTENRFDYKRIYEYCRTYRTSVEALFYGCIGIYLCKVYSCDAVGIGRNLLNRSKENMTLVSLKVDTRGFVLSPEWEQTAKEYFAGLKKKLAQQARQEENYQGRTDIVISYRPMRYLPAPGQGECREYMNSSVEVPVKLFINDDGKKIELQVKYQVKAYQENEIQKFIDKILFVMEQVLNNPLEKIGSVGITDEKEDKFIEGCGKGQEWKYSISLPERFADSIEQNFSKTALQYRDRSYSYEQIYRMVLTVKQIITGYADTEKERIVGLCMKRSPWLPVAMYASWLSGYSFMPVSPMDSQERREKIKEECAVFLTDELIETYEVSKEDESVLEHTIRTDIPAYYMYTSGTTGESKAVMISHSALSCRLEWMEEQFGDGMEVILQKTRHTFDVSVWELILPWVFGKTMCMIEDGREGCPEEIAKVMAENCVTMVHFVPSMFRYFLEYTMIHRIRYKELKYIILSGEALDAKLVITAKEYLKNVEIYNLYGPTECTIDVSYYRCSGTEKVIPIGKPVYHTGLYVVNEKGECLPPGKRGELAVTGALVGMGYFHMKDSEKSGYGIWQGNPSVKMYRTGDIAVLGEDGYFYYEGRADSQVKIRGMRVNPEEIECILNDNSSEVWNVILYINGRLIDIYSGEEEDSVIRKKAASLLPYYCVPSEYVKVQKIPTGSHGKVDRNRLRAMYREIVKGSGKKQLSSNKKIREKEEVLLEIAQKCLGRQDIGLDDNLFDIGMDSLLVLTFISECEQHGIGLSYQQIYESTDIKELAEHQYIEKKGLIYLSEESKKKLLLMIPFAGGTPYHYQKIAQKMKGSGLTLAAVNMPFYLENTVEEIANDIVGIVKQNEYQEIYMCGSCVGSGLTIKLALLLEKELKGMLLCESLPYTGRRERKNGRCRVLWDDMPDNVLEDVLQVLRGKRFKITTKMKKCFRADVRKSAEYLSKKEKISPKCSVIMLYGGKDILTAGFKYRYSRWKQWIDSPYKIYTCKSGKHFMTEDYPEVIVRIIKRHFAKE